MDSWIHLPGLGIWYLNQRSAGTSDSCLRDPIDSPTSQNGFIHVGNFSPMTIRASLYRATFHYLLLHFTDVILSGLSLTPFYRWGSWDSKRIDDSPKELQSVTVEPGLELRQLNYRAMCPAPNWLPHTGMSLNISAGKSMDRGVWWATVHRVSKESDMI